MPGHGLQKRAQKHALEDAMAAAAAEGKSLFDVDPHLLAVLSLARICLMHKAVAVPSAETLTSWVDQRGQVVAEAIGLVCMRLIFKKAQDDRDDVHYPERFNALKVEYRKVVPLLPLAEALMADDLIARAVDNPDSRRGTVQACVHLCKHPAIEQTAARVSRICLDRGPGMAGHFAQCASAQVRAMTEAAFRRPGTVIKVAHQQPRALMTYAKLIVEPFADPRVQREIKTALAPDEWRNAERTMLATIAECAPHGAELCRRYSELELE